MERNSKVGAKKSTTFILFNTPHGFLDPICFEHLGKSCSCIERTEVGKVGTIKKVYETEKEAAACTHSEAAKSECIYTLNPDVKGIVCLFEASSQESGDHP